jgi:hypothetical protein
MQPTQAENRQAWAELKEAYDTGLLEWPASSRVSFFGELPGVPQCFADAIADQPNTPQRIDHIADQFDEPARDTRRIQYQDAGWRYFTRDLPGGAITVNTAYEIARFIVAPDESGQVRHVGTYVGVTDPATGDIQNLSPFDPWALEHAGVNGYWFLRLYQNTFGPMPPPDIAVPPAFVAGYPFPELPYWLDYRFQWGRDNNGTLFLIPSNHALRLYFVPTSDDDQLIKEMVGRLVGFTQPIDTLPAAKNALYAW